MKVKHLCLSFVLAFAAISPISIAAQENSEIEPQSIEAWYGSDSFSAGSTTIYIAASITYANGSWSSSCYYNGWSGSYTPTSVVVTKTGMSTSAKTVSYTATVATAQGTYSHSGTVKVYAS